MVEKVIIKNYKSIEKLYLPLSGVNIFIGANGSGKSNILEGVTIGTAAAAKKLDNEYLSLRGLRVSDPRLMRNAFEVEMGREPIEIKFRIKGKDYLYSINNDNKEYSKWEVKSSEDQERLAELAEFIKVDLLQSENNSETADKISVFLEQYKRKNNSTNVLKDFIIYSPENNELRKFEDESKINPLGVSGEGLFRLLKSMDDDRIKELKANLRLIDWFEDFFIDEDPSSNERKIQLKDKYIDEKINFFDQRNANEGFLFLLFYLTLFISNYTPKFFSIDNVDNALNPKLCVDLVKTLNKLSKKYQKQVILTTHNPAILDGINLTDSNVNLYVVFRNLEGITKVKKISKSSFNYESDVRLSEAFTRGFIGGLNKSMIKW